MAEVIWSPRAQSDLPRIRAYIAQHAPIASAAFTARLASAAESLKDHPERGRRAYGSLREHVLVHPYLIRYRVLSDHIRILRIKHGAQRR